MYAVLQQSHTPSRYILMKKSLRDGIYTYVASFKSEALALDIMKSLNNKPAVVEAVQPERKRRAA